MVSVWDNPPLKLIEYTVHPSCNTVHVYTVYLVWYIGCNDEVEMQSNTYESMEFGTGYLEKWLHIHRELNFSICTFLFCEENFLVRSIHQET